MNRGGYEMSQLIHACRANDVTDFIVVHEHRGVPDSLVSLDYVLDGINLENSKNKKL